MGKLSLKRIGKNHWKQPYKTELSISNFRTNLDPKIEKKINDIQILKITYSSGSGIAEWNKQYQEMGEERRTHINRIQNFILYSRPNN